jgi:hypothetical protein
MASIAAPLAHIKQHLTQVLPASLILQILASLNVVWRKRKLDPVLTVHLLLLQLLGDVAFASLRHVAGVAVSAQALCKAQQKLPLELLLRLVETLSPHAAPCGRSYRRHRVVLADGMSFLVDDTPALGNHFGRSKNHRGTGQNYPVPKLLALMDHASGMLIKVIALPWARQEATCLTRLLKALMPGDLLLADRGLVGFVPLAYMTRQGLEGLFRLPRRWAVKGKTRAKAAHRLIHRLGKQDLLVQWTRENKPRWLSRRRFAALPEHLELRQIAFRLGRQGFRPTWAYVLTTLTDPVTYPAQELVELYAQRWQVEVYFRDLKQTLGFKKLRARTIAGVRKQIVGLVIAYNLLRHITVKAAHEQQVTPDRISFTDALAWLWWSTSDTLERLVVNPRRRRPTQPRLTKTRRRFGRLSRPRKTYVKPPSECRL